MTRKIFWTRFFCFFSFGVTHLLFAAHLLYNGAGLFLSLLPLLGFGVAFIRFPLIKRLQQVLFLLYTIEWLRATYALVYERILQERSYDVALAIMLSVSLFTLLQLFISARPTLQNYYQKSKSSEK